MTELDKQWNIQYEKLVEFKRKNGHCMVPFKYEQDMSLVRWVSRQRHIRTNNVIPQDRKDLLDEIGFIWKVRVDYKPAIVSKSDKSRHTKWYNEYEKLVEFKRKNGHCMVPYRYEQDKSLGKWASSQRTRHARGMMLSVRKDMLDEIGFVWKADGDKLWHQHYEKLVDFKRNNGHCMVPCRYEHDKSLGKWVSTQRTGHANGVMLSVRKDLLDEIGFAWKGAGRHHHNNKIWYHQYEKLVEFKRTNGHCMVQQKYEQDKSLGMWISSQRTGHANGVMSSVRKDLLDEIGLVWKGAGRYHNNNNNNNNRIWHQQYEKLVEFK
jgi:hypothetical protein